MIQKINIIEHLKKFFVKRFSNETNEDKRRIANLVIDGFIVFKWFLVVMLFIFNINNIVTDIIVCYLLYMNIHTYFYYHVWKESAIRGQARSVKYIRRKFSSLMLSIAYVVFVYAYLYKVGANYHFQNMQGCANSLYYIYHSLASTLTGGSSYVSPSDSMGIVIQGSQLIVTFIFIGIILSKADTIDE